jgi:hypothetical protein
LASIKRTSLEIGNGPWEPWKTLTIIPVFPTLAIINFTAGRCLDGSGWPDSEMGDSKNAADWN